MKSFNFLFYFFAYSLDCLLIIGIFFCKGIIRTSSWYPYYYKYTVEAYVALLSKILYTISLDSYINIPKD